MKLNTRRTVDVGFAFMSICAFWQIYDSIVPLMLKNTFGIDGTLKGVIMALDNVLALVLLPVLGALSDRTQTRFGRRMPFIVCGTAASVVFLMLLPLADDLVNLPLFCAALGLVLLSMASYRSPAVALMPDVTPKPLRSKGNAVINLMGTIGGIAALLSINFLVPDSGKPDYLPLFAVLAGFMLICIGILVLRVNEPALCRLAAEETAAMHYAEQEEEDNAGKKLPKDVRRSLILILASVFLLFMGYNAVSTWFSTYATTVWGMKGGSFSLPLTVAQGAALAAYVPVGALSSRIGRKRTILCGAAVLALCFGSCLFFTAFSPVIYVLFVLAGAGYAAIIVNIFPMVWEMCRGADVGRYTGYYYTMSMSAQIITPIVSSTLMSAGYRFLGSADPDAGYALLFPYAAVFIAGCFVTMTMVRHGDAKPVKKSALEAFDVDD